METSTAYQSYISAMQNYQTPQGRETYQAPYAEAFEAIYNQAKDSDVTLLNAKQFLENLSYDELRTLQQYSGLAEAIDVGVLSPEGAYNLLMHDNEQYDFNNDGVAEVGEGKHILAVPITMDAKVRDAYISALNSLDDKDKLMAMTLTFDVGRISASINNTPYTPPTIDYNYLKTQVENLLNPKAGGYTSDKTKAVITEFWNAFNAAYKGDKTENSEETDPAVAQFLHDLLTKGAAKFLADLNQEKIDKLVEEYRQKLIEQMGDSPEALEKIETMVEAFKKQLIEEMMDKMEEEKKMKQEVVFMSPETTMLAILDSHQEKKTPLEALLQN
jgi:hypothetical protein